MNSKIKLLVIGAVLVAAACAKKDDALGGAEGSPERQLNIGSAALSGGLPQAALKSSRNVLEHDPTNVRALLEQADALMTLDRGEAAAEAYRRAFAQNASPTREQLRQAMLGLGRAQLLTGHPDTAEAVFQRLVTAYPSDPNGRDGLGIALDMQDRHAEAQVQYRTVLAQEERDGTRVNLGLSLAMGGQAMEAVGVLRPLAQDPSASTRVRHNLAFALDLAGDRAEAERILAPDMPHDKVVATLSGYDAFRSAQQP